MMKSITQKFKNIFGLLLITLPLTLISCGNKTNPETYVAKNHVILMCGQSNMVGYTPTSDLIGDPLFDVYKAGSSNVKYLMNCESRILDGSFMDVSFGLGRSTNHFGPEIGLTYSLRNAKDNYYLVKVAWGSTSLVDGEWVSPSQNINTGKLYNNLVDEISNVEEVLDDIGVKDFDYAAFLWMQGEADASNNVKSLQYEECMKSLIKDVRDETGNKNMAIIDALIAPNHSYYNNVNQAKKNIDKDVINTEVVDTIGAGLETNPSDIWHYTAESMIELGKLFGNNILKFCQ